RVTYSKYLNTTNTNLTLAGYRYATKNYFTFNEINTLNKRTKNYQSSDEDRYDNTSDLSLNEWDAIRSARPRNTLTLTVNQKIYDGYGSFYISGTQRDYWSDNQKSREYQIGYSNSIKHISYSVSMSRTRNKTNNEDNRFYLNVSLPLSLFDNNNWLSSGLSTVNNKYQQSNITVSGTALPSNLLSYSLTASNQNDGGSLAGFNTTYRSQVATVGGSYSEADDYRQVGLSASGSIVASPWNVLTTNENSDTLIIVEAPKAGGRMVNGDASVITNKNGLALVPYVTPYRQNSITLSDTEGSYGADLEGNIKYSVPFQGAITKVTFTTDTRTTRILKVNFDDYTPLPFGAEVLNEKNQEMGYVGQSSTLYIKYDQPPKIIKVKMKNQTCQFNMERYEMNNSINLCTVRK
ncbi:fimbrial biogenesis outer membrane usher protein, partial [Rosenbergiella sp. S61]